VGADGSCEMFAAAATFQASHFSRGASGTDLLLSKCEMCMCICAESGQGADRDQQVNQEWWYRCLPCTLCTISEPL
jgi:hypothetical protein